MKEDSMVIKEMLNFGNKLQTPNLFGSFHTTNYKLKNKQVNK